MAEQQCRYSSCGPDLHFFSIKRLPTSILAVKRSGMGDRDGTVAKRCCNAAGRPHLSSIPHLSSVPHLSPLR